MKRTIEIERKFLVKNTSVLDGVKGEKLEQGYLSIASERTIRIRRMGENAWITVKSKTEKCSRREFEYDVPTVDAEYMLKEMCIGTIIHKVRHLIKHAGKIWEVDVFEEPYAGLVIAEVELESENEEIALPSWVGEEVTHDRRYFNSNLSARSTLEAL